MYSIASLAVANESPAKAAKKRSTGFTETELSSQVFNEELRISFISVIFFLLPFKSLFMSF